MVTRDESVEVDQIDTRDLQEIFDAYSGLASRFYQSLALILAQRLRDTSRELAREMSLRDRRQ